MAVSQENYRYDMSGLPNVMLVGIDVARCPNCGEYEMVIHAIESLHRTIAEVLIEKQGRLDHDEIRFLRKHLNVSATEFAELVDAAPPTVSRWERGSQRMSLMAERLLRLMVINQDRAGQYPLERLARAGTASSRGPSRLRLRLDRGAWKPAAA